MIVGLEICFNIVIIILLIIIVILKLNVKKEDDGLIKHETFVKPYEYSYNINKEKISRLMDEYHINKLSVVNELPEKGDKNTLYLLIEDNNYVKIYIYILDNGELKFSLLENI